MIIIGLSGKKLSGKDTIVEMVIELSKTWCEENSFFIRRIGFADALYREVAIAINPCPSHFAIWQKEQWIEGTIAYIKMHKENFRLILQGWGTNYRRKLHREDYWTSKVRDCISAMSNNTLLLISDVRFKNEIESLPNDSIIWRVNRDIESTDTHPSETELEEVDPRYNMIFDNNGTLEELRVKVKEKLKSILI